MTASDEAAPAIAFAESFDLPVAPSEAWIVLNDVARIAPCMPGVSDVETIGPADWRAKLGIKVGPLGMEFDATIHSEPVPGTDHTAKLTLAATETTGKGTATAIVLSTITAMPPDASKVAISNEIFFSGIMGRYLRGPMVTSVGRQLTKRFAQNLRQELGAAQAEPGGAVVRLDRGPLRLRLRRALKSLFQARRT